MSTIDTNDGASLRVFPPVLVYTRAFWGDDWTLRPDLRVNAFEWVANPSLDQAELEWRYGLGQQPGSTDGFESVAALSIKGHYVKIVVDPDEEFDSGEIPPWYGVVIEDHKGLMGELNAELAQQSGRQILICWGMAHLLDGQPINGSWIEADDEEESQEELINRCIAFNLGKGGEHDAGHELQPNASSGRGDKDTEVFARVLDDEAQAWTAWDIIEYLCAYFPPRDSSDTPVVKVELSGSGATGHLACHEPRLAYEGATLKALLDYLQDRRRLSGYTVDVGDDEQLVIQPFTYCAENIDLGEGGVIEANADQVSLVFDRDVWLAQATLRASAAIQYDQVVVRGARRGSVFTVSAEDDTLVKHWGDEEQTDYNNGASDGDGYDDADPAEQFRRNEAFRTSDTMKRVYAYFGLPDDWDGEAGDGEGGTKNPAMPRLDDDLELVADSSLTYWVAGLRFERHLPLETDHDYTEDVAEPEDNTPEGLQAELLPLMVAMKLNADDFEEDPPYSLVDRLASPALGGSGEHLPTWSASVQVQQQAPGIVLRVHGGPQHRLALDEWSPADDADAVANDADLDWNDNLLATVYMLNDAYLEAKQPTDGELENEDYLRVLFVSCKEAFLDYVAPGTVVGIDDGELQRVSDGGFVRDDRQRVRDLAKLAFAWYGAQRNCISLTWKGIKRLVDVGQLITEIGAAGETTTVNTVVTKVRYDFAGGGTTSIETQAAELDLTHFGA